MTKTIVTVYQVKAELTREFGFMGLRELKDVSKQTEVIDMKPYEVVFGANRVDNVGMFLGEAETDIRLLEFFFKLTNDPAMQQVREVLVEHFHYKGRSISVSDIIKINDIFYYCDSYGWKEVQVKNTPFWITVGMGASGTYWTDWTPFEVIKVSPSHKTITIREMDWEVIEGSTQNGSAEYTYLSNPKGEVKTVRFTKKGWRTPDGMRISFGTARRYYDPSF